jgi:polygalacturonase
MHFLFLFLLALATVRGDGWESCADIVPVRQRGAWISLKSFGAVGDGTTVNTAAFARAIARIERRKARGLSNYLLL